MTEKDKELKAYSQPSNKPQWLSLFSTPEKREFSPIIFVEDVSPIFFYGRPKRDEKGNLETLERSFNISIKGVKQTFNVSVLPARIKIGDNYQEFYLGAKEEIILDVLRKMIVEGDATILDERLGVIFKLSDIAAKLKEVNKTASYEQIKRSLIKLRRTTVSIYRDGAIDSPVLDESIVSKLSFGTGKGEQAYIIFNTFTEKSLKQGNYRYIDFYKMCSYKSIAAKKLHKRLAHSVKQFGIDSSYEFKMTSFLKNSGLGVHQKRSNNVEQMEKAFAELKKNQVILSISEDKIFEGRKLVDVMYSLKCHPSFGAQMKKINALTSK